MKLSSDDSLLEYAKGRVEVPTELLDPGRMNEQANLKSNEAHSTTLSPTPSVAAFANTDSAATVSQREGPLGVGGWLLLLVVGMMVLGPLLGAGRINADIMMVEHQYPELATFDKWRTFKSVTWLVFVAVAALSFFGGWGLARGKDWSVVKRAKVILWLTGPVASLVMGVLIPIITFGESNAVDGQFVGAFIASIIAASIWTAYLTKSKRVGNTYFNSP